MDAQEDDFQPIRALNDLLFCERRCALHFIEGIWQDTPHTLEGLRGHKHPDRQGYTTKGNDVVVARGVLLSSRELQLVGKSDIVEFRVTGNGISTPYPIEYKRGKRRKWDNDEVQLCAQAMCLEEMLDVSVPLGAIFHLKSKRRREVEFTRTLRNKTRLTATQLHELIASGSTPPPVIKPRCQGCSLRDLCLPECLQETVEISKYVADLFRVTPDTYSID